MKKHKVNNNGNGGNVGPIPVQKKMDKGEEEEGKSLMREEEEIGEDEE